MKAERKFKGKSAFYFEDQPDKVEGITEHLNGELGIEVVTARSPKEAFECMSKRKFDLVILDIRIVGGDQKQDGAAQDWTRYGVYFLSELREGRIKGPTPREVPVLVITCVVNTTDVDQIGEIGRSSGGLYRYVPKPIPSLSVIETAVTDLLSPEGA